MKAEVRDGWLRIEDIEIYNNEFNTKELCKILEFLLERLKQTYEQRLCNGYRKIKENKVYFTDTFSAYFRLVKQENNEYEISWGFGSGLAHRIYRINIIASDISEALRIAEIIYRNTDKNIEEIIELIKQRTETEIIRAVSEDSSYDREEKVIEYV